MTIQSRFVLAVAVVVIAGCDAMPPKRGDSPEFLATMPPQPLPQQFNNGAIFQPAQSRGLFEDYKARQVGDLLNVLLVERTDASKSAKTSISKDASSSFDAALSTTGASPSFSATSGHAFDGEGDSEQSNKLNGQITVTVSEVLPNGNLIVQGEKWVGINQGQEYVRLRGIVRPIDITSSNTVNSTQVGDVQIYYGGNGAVRDSNVMGWIMRFFISALMPF